MFRPSELLESLNGMTLPAESPSDIVRMMGGSKISMTREELEGYRFRIDSGKASQFHQSYRSGGLYVIEFPSGVFIGSVHGPMEYFGRRWRHICLVPERYGIETQIRKTNPALVRFHVIHETETASLGRFLEYGALAFVESYAPQFLLNRKSFKSVAA